MNKQDLPVFALYNLHRKVRFSIRYLCEITTLDKKINRTLEISIALSASSAFAGLWFWRGFGIDFWAIFSAGVAILAFIKPYLDYETKIFQQARLITSYRAIQVEIEKLEADIKFSNKYSDEHHIKTKLLMDRYKEIETMEPVERYNDKIRDKCFALTAKELPTDSFFIPEEECDE